MGLKEDKNPEDSKEPVTDITPSAIEENEDSKILQEPKADLSNIVSNDLKDKVPHGQLDSEPHDLIREPTRVQEILVKSNLKDKPFGLPPDGDQVQTQKVSQIQRFYRIFTD